MPAYEFDCQKCGRTFTEHLTIGEYEKALQKGFRCPKCQSKRVEQRLGAQVQTSKKS